MTVVDESNIRRKELQALGKMRNAKLAEAAEGDFAPSSLEISEDIHRRIHHFTRWGHFTRTSFCEAHVIETAFSKLSWSDCTHGASSGRSSEKPETTSVHRVRGSTGGSVRPLQRRQQSLLQ